MKRCAMLGVGVVLLGSILCVTVQQTFADVATYSASRDNWLFQAAAASNYGAGEAMCVGGYTWGSETYGISTSIVGFNMADNAALNAALAGGTAQVNSVTLRLQTGGYSAYGASGGTSTTTNVHALLDANADWLEGSSYDAVETGASCFVMKGCDTTAWASGVTWAPMVAGTDYDATVLATHTFNSDPGVSTVDFSFGGTSSELTAFLTHWATATNGGLLLREPNPGTTKAMMIYATSESAASPQLIVDWTSVSVPEPGTMMLLCCGLAGLVCYAWRKRK